jgi:Flp pilus assembly protein TadG
MLLEHHAGALVSPAHPKSRKRPATGGQGLVEFALIVPIILMILLGAIDLGRAAYAQSTISNAARTGTRIAIVDQHVSTDCIAHPAVARCVAARQAVALGLDANDVALTFLNSDLQTACNPIAIGCLAEITVTYTFVPITPVVDAITGTITMASTTRLPVERIYVSP